MTTKNELAAMVSDHLPGVTRSAAKETVDTLFNLMANEMAQGNEVKIADFGNFTVKKMKARNARNPATGEAIVVPARSKLVFKPASALKGRLPA